MYSFNKFHFCTSLSIASISCCFFVLRYCVITHPISTGAFIMPYRIKQIPYDTKAFTHVSIVMKIGKFSLHINIGHIVCAIPATFLFCCASGINIRHVMLPLRLIASISCCFSIGLLSINTAALQRNEQVVHTLKG